jgi:hypothetical protein
VILADVNVLVNAFRPDARDHEVCHTWLGEVISGQARYGVSPQVLSSVIRVVTHPRIFVHPSDTADVLRFCRVLLEQAHAKVVAPGERHWGIFQRLLSAARVRGNIVSDAWFAALAIESGCEWITLDRDYGKFAGLRWRRPGKT